MTTVLPIPSAWRLGAARGGIELRCFFRERDLVVFTFALPAVLLVLLGSVFTEKVTGTGVTASQVFTAGLIAGGVASTSFVGIGIGVAADRDDGTLRRLRGMPLPPAAYFLGKVILVLVASLAEVVLLLTVGVLMFGLPLPTEPARWLTCAWVFALGVTACALLGIAASSLARSSRSAGAVTNLPLLVLQFISGIFVVPTTDLPEVLVRIGSVFPLKWMAQGFRSVFLPDALTGQEPAAAWEHGRVAMVLAAWCIGGLALCLTTFRWHGRRDG